MTYGRLEFRKFLDQSASKRIGPIECVLRVTGRSQPAFGTRTGRVCKCSSRQCTGHARGWTHCLRFLECTRPQTRHGRRRDSLCALCRRRRMHQLVSEPGIQAAKIAGHLLSNCKSNHMFRRKMKPLWKIIKKYIFNVLTWIIELIHVQSIIVEVYRTTNSTCVGR